MKSFKEHAVTRKAYAKINLGLDVVRRREDGYHEVRMIMQSVGIYDVLTFMGTQERDIVVTTDKEELPGGETNLVYRAAKLLKETYGLEYGVCIDLNKNIPMAAGMAGGSTDAAAVFHGMNELFDMGLTTGEMCRLAVKIGADVPYCIQGGTALAEGIGELLSGLPQMPDCHLLIAKPEIGVSTKYVYENLHADRLRRHPDIDGMARSLKEKDLAGVAMRMENVLETVTAVRYPVIEEIKAFMKEQGALNALMSGSGPTVFGVFDSEEKARLASEALTQAKLAKQIFVTVPVNGL